MKKVLININNETICFSYKVDKTREEKDLTKTLINTNIISNNDLIFSDTYIKNNLEIISVFLKEIIASKKIKKAVVLERDIIILALDIIKPIKQITNFHIVPDISIDYGIFEKLKECNYLKYLNCFEIPKFMIEEIDNILIDVRCEIVSISNFVYQNNLVNYTKLYYRKTLKIFTKFNYDDISDFETFIKINRNLKCIHIYDVDFDTINKIYEIMRDNHNFHVKILIHQNLENTSIIEKNLKDFRMLNKKFIKYCDSQIKIVYSLDYIKKNFLKQLTLSNLKVCMLIIFLLGILIFISYGFNNKKTGNIHDINHEYSNFYDAI